jgi:hypothetical protein
VVAHLRATDACPVMEAAGESVSTVRTKSTYWKEAASGGIVKAAVPVRGTSQQSSLVKRIYRAVGQRVALSPLVSQLRVTDSPGQTSAGLTEKAMTSGRVGTLVDVGAGVLVGDGVAVEVGLASGVGVAVGAVWVAVDSGVSDADAIAVEV